LNTLETGEAILRARARRVRSARWRVGSTTSRIAHHPERADDGDDDGDVEGVDGHPLNVSHRPALDHAAGAGANEDPRLRNSSPPTKGGRTQKPDARKATGPSAPGTLRAGSDHVVIGAREAASTAPPLLAFSRATDVILAVNLAHCAGAS